jgi:hypothetical protein
VSSKSVNTHNHDEGEILPEHSLLQIQTTSLEGTAGFPLNYAATACTLRIREEVCGGLHVVNNQNIASTVSHLRNLASFEEKTECFLLAENFSSQVILICTAGFLQLHTLLFFHLVKEKKIPKDVDPRQFSQLPPSRTRLARERRNFGKPSNTNIIQLTAET